MIHNNTNHEGIVTLPIELPNKTELEQRFGVNFIALEDEDVEQVNRLNDTFLRSRREITDTDSRLAISMSKKAVLFKPEFVLATQLSPEQIRSINEQMTPEIARYCVAIQTDLALVPIEENYDNLTHLPAAFRHDGVSASFSDVPFHAACGEWAGQPREFWARDKFADRLLLMGKILDSAGVQLHFEDAFRPVGVQEGLFKRRVEWTRRDHPDWNEEQIINEAQSKTAVKPRLASHKGGAAVDARLTAKDTKTILDFGHDYPDGGALVFPMSPFITAEQWRNRQLFQIAAGLSDITLYVGEDWHISYGDNLASLDEYGSVRNGYTAQYGPIKDFDRVTGQITNVYDKDEMDFTFDF